MATTHQQAKALAADIAKASGPSIAWQTGKMVNALLEQAKSEQPDNIVLSAIDPLRPHGTSGRVSRATWDDIRAIVGQIVAATTPATTTPAAVRLA
jgi:hypothetical protein